MKSLLHALALCGLVTLSTSISAQSEACSEAKKAECRAGQAAAVAAKDDCCGSSDAKLASVTKDGQCSSLAKAAKQQDCVEKSACSKGAAAELASVAQDGQCSSLAAADKSACSKGAVALASKADGAQCHSQKAKRPTPAAAQLASLIRPNRVAGVVIDGRAYLGSKAIAVVDTMVRRSIGAQIASVCEESRQCSKTLAMNVDKRLAGKICMQTELSSLITSGQIDSLIIDDESAVGEAALASLTKIMSCDKFQAECRTLASAPAPAEVKQAAAKQCEAKKECGKSAATLQ